MTAGLCAFVTFGVVQIDGIFFERITRITALLCIPVFLSDAPKKRSFATTCATYLARYPLPVFYTFESIFHAFVVCACEHYH